ncbi:MAG TPA: hypothetical protein VI485_04250 [Vicinamibacterales bacterium]|nr:hypothetical protein [Vicinamibacterales bacterium]
MPDEAMPDEIERRRFLFDFFIHEAEAVNMRADWFLIFHAILFEAFLGSEHMVHRLTLGAIGCITSWVWLAVGIRQSWDLKYLGFCISDKSIMGRDIGSVFDGLFKARRQQQHWSIMWARSTPAFCIVLPCVVLVAWVIFTVAPHGRVAPRNVLGVVGLLAVVTWFWRTLRKRPRISRATITDLGQGEQPGTSVIK